MTSDALRIARFLSAGCAAVSPAAKRQKLVLKNDRGSIAVSVESIAEMARRGLIEQRGTQIALTTSGAAFGRRNDAVAEDFAAQHRDVSTRLLDVEGVMTAVEINHRESPLMAIARRKGRDGKPFLVADELQAGERLRSDYTRGQLMPGLGANWRAPIASSRKSGERGGNAELTDAALAARQRVENAVRSVGPELAGVLVDICCYLKGLDQVERERGWPARSAKVVLKSALGALARHYYPEREKQRPRRLISLHWGTEDYRPRIN